MKVKGFSFTRVRTRRDNIFSHALSPYIGSSIVGDTIKDLCEDLLRQLPQTVSRDALFESIRVLAGTTLGQRDARELAWRLAGNVDRLVEGARVMPWTRQIQDEVIPVRVERIQPDKRRNVYGFTMYVRALAGTPCPMVFPQFFSKQSCRAISRSLGFSSAFGLHPFNDPMHFMGLMFFAHLEADKSGDTPYFKKVSGSSGLKALNRPKIEVRCRAKPCPRGYTHACSKCWLGQEDCPAGIYPKTLIQRECAECVNMGFFEPDDEGAVCMNCRAKQHPH